MNATAESEWRTCCRIAGISDPATNERFNSFLYPFTGEGRRQLTTLADETFMNGRLLPDGEHIVAARAVFHRDVYTITNFR